MEDLSRSSGVGILWRSRVALISKKTFVLFNYIFCLERIPEGSSYYFKDPSQINAKPLLVGCESAVVRRFITHFLKARWRPPHQTSIPLEWVRRISLGCVAVNRKILNERIVHLVTHHILGTECLVRDARSGDDNIGRNLHWIMVALSDGVVEVSALVEAEPRITEDELISHIDKAKDTSPC